ncbi:DJ-1/PfpI family protein [Polaromonas sp.]|uniref:DJ-1/PfpI family protein n=1 Tax=Polaromonas sp. TaxID=1869339 RepID=UPI0025F8DF76|nr:DJ-1/PfpI family protein [Polaromonas sp.]
MTAWPGDGSIQGRKIALLMAPGVDGELVLQVQEALLAKGAVPCLVGPRIGLVATADGGALTAEVSLENEAGFLFDALVLPDGKAGVEALAKEDHTMEFIKDQYRHCKALLVLGASKGLLDKAGVPTTLPDGRPDTGLIIAAAGSGRTAEVTQTFIAAAALHRHMKRETDPPRV